MCILLGKIKQCFGTVVFHSIFLGEKCKNRLFWRKMILSAFLIIIIIIIIISLFKEDYILSKHTYLTYGPL